VHPGGIKTAIARNSRVAASADAAAAAARVAEFDRQFLTTPPRALAARIVDAVKRGRERVVAGRDAGRIDALVRLFPVRAPGWLSRRARR
jgi:hypothetical protein